MKKLFLVLVAAVLILPAMAQQGTGDSKADKKEMRKNRINAIAKQEEEGVIRYRRHTVFGGKLTTDGYGGFVEIGRAQSVRRSLLYQLDISERKDSKEEKQQLSDFNSTPVIYGKINYFYPIKLGVQQQYLLGNKGNKNGVSISANAGGGISLGLLRAYEIEVDKNGGRSSVIYDSPDSTLWLSSYTGAAKPSGPTLFKGWSNIKMTPGLYAKTGLRFDYGKYNEMVSAVEVGLTGEFYSKKIPQMIYQKEKQFFFGAYVSLVFGRRK